MVDLQGLVNLIQSRTLNGSVKEGPQVINENGTTIFLEAIQTFSIVYKCHNYYYYLFIVYFFISPNGYSEACVAACSH